MIGNPDKMNYEINQLSSSISKTKKAISDYVNLEKELRALIAVVKTGTSNINQAKDNVKTSFTVDEVPVTGTEIDDLSDECHEYIEYLEKVLLAKNLSEIDKKRKALNSLVSQRSQKERELKNLNINSNS